MFEDIWGLCEQQIKIRSGTKYLGKGFCIDLLFWREKWWCKVVELTKVGLSSTKRIAEKRIAEAALNGIAKRLCEIKHICI